MFHLCRNQVVDFYQQNVWQKPMEEWHFASKNQLPGLSLSGTLVENGLKDPEYTSDLLTLKSENYHQQISWQNVH